MPGSAPDPKIAEEALARHQTAIAAIDPKATRHVNVTGTRAVQTSQAMTPKLEQDLPRMAELFKAPPQAEADTLVDRALAYWAAEKRVDAAQPRPATDRAERFAEATRLKKRTVSVLGAVAEGDAAVMDVLEAVRPGTGYEDMADDLTRLYPHLQAHQDRIAGADLMTADQIARVGALGAELLEPAADGADLAAARTLRDQAFTYFLSAYDALLRHLTFLYWADADGLKAYPKLYAGNAK